MAQTTFGTERGVSFAGMLADDGDIDTISRAVGGAVNVGFGLMMGFGATPAEECAPLADGAAIAAMCGVTVHKHTQNRALLDGTEGLMPDDQADILRRGRVWVVTEQAVTPGDPVFVRHTAAGAEVKGAFRKDTDGGDAVDISTRARWESTTTGAGIAILDLGIV